MLIMGRIRKYKTDDELREARRQRWLGENNPRFGAKTAPFKIMSEKQKSACLNNIKKWNEKGISYWSGKQRNDGTKAKISSNRKGKCLGNKNAFGTVWTKEMKEGKSLSSKLVWSRPEVKQKYIKSISGAKNWRWNPNRQEVLDRLGLSQFYRFTQKQKKMWMKNFCKWCGSTDYLQLDHILAIINGGKNTEDNAQTLCRSCNRFKRDKIDFPLAKKQGEFRGTPIKDNPDLSRVNDDFVTRKEQRLTGEESTNNPDTSALRLISQAMI